MLIIIGCTQLSLICTTQWDADDSLSAGPPIQFLRCSRDFLPPIQVALSFCGRRADMHPCVIAADVHDEVRMIRARVINPAITSHLCAPGEQESIRLNFRGWISNSSATGGGWDWTSRSINMYVRVSGRKHAGSSGVSLNSKSRRRFDRISGADAVLSGTGFSRAVLFFFNEPWVCVSPYSS